MQNLTRAALTANIPAAGIGRDARHDAARRRSSAHSRAPKRRRGPARAESPALSVTAAVRRVTRRHPPRALILLYHRVADSHADPFRLAVSPQRFEQQLELLRGRYRVIVPGSLGGRARPGSERRARRGGHVRRRLRGQSRSRSSDRRLARDPDHGLRHRRLGAGGARFWWDELTDLVCRPGDREAVVVRVEGRRRRFRTTSANDRLRACVGLHRLLRRLPEASPTSRPRRARRDEPERRAAADRRQTAHRGRVAPARSPGVRDDRVAHRQPPRAHLPRTSRTGGRDRRLAARARKAARPRRRSLLVPLRPRQRRQRRDGANGGRRRVPGRMHDRAGGGVEAVSAARPCPG